MQVPSIIPSMDAKAQNPKLVHTIDKAVLKYQDVLKTLNQEIFSKPELCFKEFRAHDAIVTTLQGLGFTVTPHAYGIPTSFEVEHGSGGRLVIFNAEYDALPGIGHACGHNLIAVTSLAGFLATVEQLKVSGTPGRVRLLGTPAEEGGGGKVALVKKGAYENADACVMAHPAPLQSGYSVNFNADVYVPHVAIEMFKATFHGRAAHAAATPWEGVNALDAVTIAYSAISMLRQQKKSSDLIHGIITSGGTASNIIPDKCTLDYGVRAPTMARVRELKQRVVDCFHGAAMATGCTVDVEDLQVYADLRPNKLLSLQFTLDMNKWNYPVFCDVSVTEPPGGGATDQGNVSYVVPAIHPVYGIETEKGCSNHTIGFTDAAGKDNAFDRSMTIAKGLAATSWRMLSDDDFAARVKKEFDDDKKDRIESGEAVGEEEMVRKWVDPGLDNRPLRICPCGHEVKTIK